MDYERDDQAIFFKDLIFAALFRWRQMLALGVAFALVLGALGVVKALGNKTPEPTQQELEEYRVRQQTLQDAADAAQAQLDNQQRYVADSVLMNMDPYHVYMAKLELTVLSDFRIQPDKSFQDPDLTEALLFAYKTQFDSDLVLGAIAQQLQLENRYLQELMVLKVESSAKSLSISVRCKDEAMAEAVLEGFRGQLELIQTQVTRLVGEHTLSVVNDSINQRVDSALAERQTAEKNRVTELEDELALAQGNLLGLSAPGAGGVSYKKALIYAIIGLIGGAGIVACVEWVKHLAGGKVYSQRTLRNKTGIKILGCAPAGSCKCPLDNWLRKLEGRSMDEARMAVVAAGVANHCGQKKLLVTGGAGEEGRGRLLEALRQAGVMAWDGGSLLRSAEAMKALPEYDLVLLVEQCHVSGYYEITDALERIDEHNKQLLGCVLLDG